MEFDLRESQPQIREIPYLSRIHGGEDSPVGARRDRRREEWGSIRAVGDELADVAGVSWRWERRGLTLLNRTPNQHALLSFNYSGRRLTAALGYCHV